MDYPDQKKRSYESKLDLDYDNFVTKKIERCGMCGDIFYTGIQPPHACSTSEAPLNPHIPAALHTESALQMCRANAGGHAAPGARQNEPWLGAYSELDRSQLCDKIYSIWERSGFKRHFKDNAPAKQESKEAPKDKFSFSPYDNFF